MAQTGRVEVRLDEEVRRKLEEVASARGATVSGLVRDLIERSYEEEMAQRRRQAAEQLGRLELEDLPEIEVLREQLDGAHGPVEDLR
ncbi:MAG TPA: ribbon-helix-helix protein, CopG family [Rubrobacteraceae bacterium]|nr:ribbon-helix-helix protein, CopG family [Rubrobacteraceae bacterium]